jgi:transposase
MPKEPLVPFYKKRHEEFSKKIPLPKKESLIRVPLNKNFTHPKNYSLVNKFAHIYPEISTIKNTTDPRFFELFTTPLKAHIPFKTEYPANDDIEKISIKTVKIRISPTKKQKLMFNKYAAMHRYMKNLSIEIINSLFNAKKKQFSSCTHCIHDGCEEPKKEGSFLCEGHQGTQISWDLNINHESIRNKIYSYESPQRVLPKWILDTPYNMRDLPIGEAVDNYKAAIASSKVRANKKFAMSFKSAKGPTKHFSGDCRSISLKENGVVVYSRENIGVIKIKKHLMKKVTKAFIENKCKWKGFDVHCNRGKWYLLLAVNNKVNKTIKNKNDSVTFDPGQVIPLAGFVPDKGLYMNLGVDPMIKVAKNKLFIDKLRSKMDLLKNKIAALKRIKKKSSKDKQEIKSKKRTVKNMAKRIGKKYLKNEGIRDDFHNRTAAWVSKNFNNVILPDFASQKMAKGKTLSSATKEKLLAVGHYKFKTRLAYQCAKNNSSLFIVNESYTSKTCCHCGYVHVKLPSGRDYKCKQCGFESYRDFNGSVNIYNRTFNFMADVPIETAHSTDETSISKKK